MRERSDVDDRVGVEAPAHEHAAQSHESYVRQRLCADVSELARRVDFGRQHVAVFAPLLYAEVARGDVSGCRPFGTFGRLCELGPTSYRS